MMPPHARYENGVAGFQFSELGMVQGVAEFWMLVKIRLVEVDQADGLWYVDIAVPELSAYDWESGKFKPFG